MKRSAPIEEGKRQGRKVKESKEGKETIEMEEIIILFTSTEIEATKPRKSSLY